MPRVIWKGAISFGLVHVPVALYPASQTTGIDFDWLDKRSMDPVGYKRINKRTGKEIERENIVKGIKQESGEYVVLSDEEIKAAYPKSTQTIELETFVKADSIPFTYLETPYVLAPLAKGDKVYALLREAMIERGVVGVARVVMHTKERLAALIPDGDALLLNTIRWSNELRPRDDIKLPAAGKSANDLKEGELKMASQLIGDMTGEWKPEQYENRFVEAIHALAAQRLEAGETEKVTPLEADDAPAGASNVVDLTELLQRSLASRKAGADAPAKKAPARAAAGPAANDEVPAEKAPARKSSAGKAARAEPARKAAAKKTAARKRA